MPRLLIKVLVWTSLKKFCDGNYPDQKFRNDQQRKAFVLKKGLKIQKDEHGVEGIATAKEGTSDTKEIRVGKRLSASKIKQLDFGGEDADKAEMNQQNEKNKAGLQVHSNAKDRTHMMSHVTCPMTCPSKFVNVTVVASIWALWPFHFAVPGFQGSQVSC